MIKNLPESHRKEFDRFMASTMNTVLMDVVVDKSDIQSQNKIMKLYVKVPKNYKDPEIGKAYKALHHIICLTANLYNVEVHWVGNPISVLEYKHWYKKNELIEPDTLGKRVWKHENAVEPEKIAQTVYLNLVDTFFISQMRKGFEKAYAYLWFAYWDWKEIVEDGLYN